MKVMTLMIVLMITLMTGCESYSDVRESVIGRPVEQVVAEAKYSPDTVKDIENYGTVYRWDFSWQTQRTCKQVTDWSRGSGYTKEQCRGGGQDSCVRELVARDGIVIDYKSTCRN